MQHRLEASDVCDTWGDHTSQDGIADKRSSTDTETETHLCLPGHRLSKAVSRGFVVSFQWVSQAWLVVSQTAPPPAGGGALHPSSLFSPPLPLQKGHRHHQMRHQGVSFSAYSNFIFQFLLSISKHFSWHCLFRSHY